MLLDPAQFKSKAEEIKYVKDNVDTLIAMKKASLKTADGVNFAGVGSGVYMKVLHGDANKANDPITTPNDELSVLAVINTTNLMDSHLDVHIKGLWSKSLKENKSIMHLQEHQMKFDKIISDGSDLKSYTKSYTWTELGFDLEGETEALVFDSKVKKSRNAFMHKQYAEGHVKQHSVGMRYVKLVLCINSEEEYYGAEKEAWDKYFPMVANSEVAEAKGYFWAVTEAKVSEGSAVPLGSNYATPTIENNKFEPLNGTQTINTEPDKSTQKTINYKNIANNIAEQFKN